MTKQEKVEAKKIKLSESIQPEKKQEEPKTESLQPNESEVTEKDSITVSTMDTNIIKVQQSIIKKAISKMEDRNDNRTVEENKFDYNG